MTRAGKAPGALLASAIVMMLPTGCATTGHPESIPVESTEATVHPESYIGMTLDEADAAARNAGLEPIAADIRAERSILVRSNWIVATEGFRGTIVSLGVEKTTDPRCWAGATDCTWVEVTRYVADDNGESERFALNGGPARLTYTVTAETTTPGMRVADIMFQDERLNTESSHVDTIINVDTPMTDTYDLGDRDGTYFLMARTWPSNAKGVNVTVTVEEMR